MKLKKEGIYLYLIALVFLLIGIFYDKQIVSFLANQRIILLNQFFSWISFFGTWFIVLIIMTSLFLWQDKKRKWIFPLWLSLISSLLITYFLKILIARQRPFEALFPSTNSSFPSGHAAAVFSTLSILDKEFPKLKWFWLLFSVLVAFSRLYLGAHYLTDVTAGALIGYTLSFLITKWETKEIKNPNRTKVRGIF